MTQVKRASVSTGFTGNTNSLFLWIDMLKKDKKRSFDAILKYVQCQNHNKSNKNGRCRHSNLPAQPQAMIAELPTIKTSLNLILTIRTLEIEKFTLKLLTRSVSGFSHSLQRTNFRMNPSSMSCSLFASWDPFTI